MGGTAVPARVCVGLVVGVDAALAGEALECLLAVQSPTLEVLLITGHAGTGKEMPSETRCSLVTVTREPSMAEALELMLERSNASFLILLQPHQHVLPGGLPAMLERLQGDASLDMVYGLQFPADEDGRVSRSRFSSQWEAALKLQEFDPGEPSQYLSDDFLLETPRLYRRRALQALLSCGTRPSTLYGFIWTVHERLVVDLVTIPCCLNKRGEYDVESGRKALLEFPARLRALVSVCRQNITALAPGAAALEALRHGFTLTQIPTLFDKVKVQIWRWQFNAGCSVAGYRMMVRLFSRWPLPRRKEASGAGPVGTILYYIWQYPVLSQTFVQREVAALSQAGLKIRVCSEIAPEHGFLQELEPILQDTPLCLPQPSLSEQQTLRRKLFRRAPLRYLSIKLFILGKDYHPEKDLWFDRYVFNTALRLAEVAETAGAGHVHAPWADNCAFVALVAARVLGLSFSVQGRAHDLHRKDYLYGLYCRLQHAEFIVTNTRYNVEHIAGLIGEGQKDRVKLIYNGLNIDRFQAPPERKVDGNRGELRLLSVARLIDQKGLVYLLQACRVLLDEGLKLRCDIVGGSEDIFMAYYLELKRMRIRLSLQDSVTIYDSLAFDEVLPFYEGADIFVLPCVLAEDGSRDITPNSVLEAMAMQLPVVATTVTGLPELVEDGVTGALVAPGNVPALADSINTLAQSQELRRRYGHAGRKRVEQQFDSSRNSVAYQGLFREMLRS